MTRAGRVTMYGPILGEKKAGLAGPAKETPEMLTNPRPHLHRTTVYRCIAREARQRMARQEAEHRSVTIGRAGQRRPSSLALGDAGYDTA